MRGQAIKTAKQPCTGGISDRYADGALRCERLTWT